MQDYQPLPAGIPGFFQGIAAVFAGTRRLLNDRELRKLALIPLVLTAFTYIFTIGIAAILADDLSAWVAGQTAAGWQRIAAYALLAVVGLLATGLLVYLFVSVAILVGAPFYEKMALSILKEKGMPAQEVGLVYGLGCELVRTALFLAPWLALLPLSLLTWFSGFLWILGAVFSAMLAFVTWIGAASAMLGPSLLASGMKLRPQIRYVLRSKMCLAGVGAVVTCSLLVPFLGLLIIPAATVGATLLFAKHASA